ncbi:MAG: hypothetical protein ACREE6_10790 [Limisphaerales bacterium]
MKETAQKTAETDNQPRLDENAECDICGRPGAFHFGDRAVCLECYCGRGSCCPEFGKDDLWSFPDED